MRWQVPLTHALFPCGRQHPANLIQREGFCHHSQTDVVRDATAGGQSGQCARHQSSPCKPARVSKARENGKLPRIAWLKYLPFEGAPNRASYTCTGTPKYL